jgi:hypothetical protein
MDAESDQKWPYILGAAALFVLGVSLIVATASIRHGIRAKAERLTVEGFGVSARIYDSSAGRHTLKLSYGYEGRAYKGTISCGSYEDCSDPGPTIVIQLDREHPERFYADNGDTDDWNRFLNHPSYYFWGGILMVPAVLVLLLWILTRRPPRRPGRATWPDVRSESRTRG